MLHRADWDFANRYGGVLTQAFLSKLRNNPDWNGTSMLIDSRVHMLMEHFIPAIPGWHHDDVARTRSDGQPDYENMPYQAEHVMALWGDCSLTEFAIGKADFDIPPVGQKIYKVLSPAVEKMCESGTLRRVQVPEHQLVYFDWASWHRAVPATKRGFRFFIRATRNSGLVAKNEIRFNANVYMENLEEGW